MTRFTKDSKYRLRDFKRRGLYSPDGIYVNSSSEQKYITMHPFGDDRGLIKKLDLTPQACKAVDAYWNMSSDVSFIQVGTTELYKGFKPGYYAQWAREKKEYLTLTCVTVSEFITRSEFEQIMCGFLELGCMPTEALRRKLKTRQFLA